MAYLFKHFLEHLTGRFIAYTYALQFSFVRFLWVIVSTTEIKKCVSQYRPVVKWLKETRPVFAQDRISQKYYQKLEELARSMLLGHSNGLVPFKIQNFTISALLLYWPVIDLKLGWKLTRVCIVPIAYINNSVRLFCNI